MLQVYCMPLLWRRLLAAVCVPVWVWAHCWCATLQLRAAAQLVGWLHNSMWSVLGIRKQNGHKQLGGAAFRTINAVRMVVL